MKKLQKTLRAEPHTRGLVKLTFDYSAAINGMLKEHGGRWNPDIRKWTLPIDNLPALEYISSEAGLLLENLASPSNTSPSAFPVEAASPSLYPWQRRALEQFWDHQSFILAFDPGLGKTFTTIEYLRLKGITSVLVVCPAMVLYTWEEELNNWWKEHPNVFIVNQSALGKLKRGTLEFPQDGVVISSYARLHHIPEGRTFQAIVFDELHYLQSAKSDRGQNAKYLAHNNPEAVCIGLSGTLIPNKPDDLWNPLDTLMPSEWSSWHGFVKKYCDVSSNAYSNWVVGGLKEGAGEELQQRLSKVALRVTMNEAAEFLPPYSYTSLIFEPDFIHSGFSMESVGDLDEFLSTSGVSKVDKAIEVVEEERKSYSGRICLLTYHVNTANELADKLAEEGHQVYKVTGEDGQIEARKEIIREATAIPDSILVCSMKSIGIGLNDLVGFSNIILAELYWQPGVIIQTLGRFYRLSSKEPVSVKGIVFKGTIDEIIATSLKERIADINKVIKSGTLEERLQASLIKEPTQEEMLESLRKVTEEYERRRVVL